MSPAALQLVSRDAAGRPHRRRIPPTRVRGWIKSLAGRRIAVVGDLILDAFLWGDATRISPEAPVPVVLLDRQSWTLGGAGNVAANIAALGGEAVLYSAVGDDTAGVQVIDLMRRVGLSDAGLLRLPGRPTTVKNRVFASNKHLLRFDREDTTPYPPTVAVELARLLRAGGRYDAVIVSDYAKGCVTAPLARAVGAFCRARKLTLCVDPKNTALRFPQARVLKPNLAELQALAGMPVHDLASLRVAAARTLKQQGCANLLVTRGRDGMALFARDGSVTWLDGGGHQVADVTGAGDTVTAALALGLAAGLEVSEAAMLANLAGGYVVTLPGTAVVHPGDLDNWLE